MEPTKPQNTERSQAWKLVIAVVLLGLAFVFWRWSVGYENRDYQSRAHDRMGHMQQDQAKPMSDAEIDKELQASLNASSEMELKEIDSQF